MYLKIEQHQHEMRENQNQERGCYTQLNRIKEKITRIKFEMNEQQQIEEPMPMDVTTLVSNPGLERQ